METREQIVEQLNELTQKSAALRIKLDAFDRKEIIEGLYRYKGRYFREYSSNDKYVRCLFVYSVDEKLLRTKALTVSDYSSNDEDAAGTYFSIEYNELFDPNRWEDDKRWQEITKEEFMKQYEAVQNKISNSLNN